MAHFRPPRRTERGNSMKKGIPLILGLMVSVLILTSFLSAVNSEILIAKNATLVIKPQPVVASGVTISELDPEKYDSMIHSFQAPNDAVIFESGQNNMNEVDARHSDERLLSTASDEATNVETTDEPANEDKLVHSNVILSESPDTTDNDTVYTVQAGSYTQRFNAELKYKSIIHSMNASDLDNLRIENVGEHYTVRLGRFDHYVTAMKFLNAMNSRLPSAIVLKAYIKNERIVKLYNDRLLAEN